MIPNNFKNIKVLAIVEGCGSASKLLQSHLDGHKEIMMTPGYNLMYFYPHWFEWKKKGKLEVSDLIESFLKKHPSLLEDDKNIKIDKKIFKRKILNFLDKEEINSKNFLIAIHLSYAECIGQNVSEKNILLYHLHTNSYLKYLEKDFKDINIIYMIREIDKNLIRRVEHGLNHPNNKNFNYTDAKLINLKSYIEILYLFSSFIFFEKFNNINNKIFICHNSLKNNQKNLLNKICNFLNISFSEKILEPTINGKKWKTLPNPADSKQKYFNYEKIWMSYIFNDFTKKFYSKNEIRKFNIFFLLKSFFSILLPSKIEFQNLYSFINMSQLSNFIKNIKTELNDVKFYNYNENSFYRHKWTNKFVPYKFLNIINSINRKNFLGKLFYFIIKLLYIPLGLILVLFLYIARVIFCLSLLPTSMFLNRNFPHKI